MGGKSRKPDASGWATKYGVVCSDGLTIGNGCFGHADGTKVPIVYQHNHNDASNVLGHGIMHAHGEGVRADLYFDETPQGANAKKQVASGTLDSLSIYAKNVKKQGNIVQHADLIEVSLVLKGANPQATIDQVFIQHDDGDLEEAGEIVIAMGAELEHAEDETPEPEADEDDKTIGEIYEAMTDEQKAAVQAMLVAAVEANMTDEDNADSDTEEGQVGHNVFDKSDKDDTLQHNEADREGLIHAMTEDAKKGISFKASYLAHAFNYGISNPEMLFPEPKDTGPIAELRRDQSWVSKVVGGATSLPFMTFRSRYAVLTGDEIRARGYVTGSRKFDTVYSSLKRTTTGTTVVVKTRLDRDTELDITDYDIWGWMKSQLTIDMMEELGRAYLVGDGRPMESADKIDENKIRPVVSDDDLYSVKYALSNEALQLPEAKPDLILEEVSYALEDYRGKSDPMFFATRRTINRLLWLRDKYGRRLHETRTALADALGVSALVEVPLLKAAKVALEGGEKDVLGVVYNPSDYFVGSNPGGQLTSFEDFDIDYNQKKALLETRRSGALRDPGTAIVLTGKLPDMQGPARAPKKSSDPQLPDLH